MKESLWRYSPDHEQICQVIKTQTLWGEATCRVWLPGRDSVVRIPASKLVPLKDSRKGTSDDIVYVATAARIADALSQDVLLAPIESSVIPLPHQIKALSRAIAGDRVRYLLRKEEHSWNEELERKAQVHPEMVPLLVIRVEGGAHE